MLFRALLLVVLFFLLARAVWRLLAGVARGAMGPGAGSTAPKSVKMAQCPACGTYVVPGKAISDVRNGQMVYFCSERCRKAA